MIITKTYKYRLKLSKEQEHSLNNQLGICRMVYNLAKETKDFAWRQNGVSLSMYDLQKQLTDLKKEFDWIKNVHSQTLQNVLERLEQSYKKLYKKKGRPRWAKKDEYTSLTFKSVSQISDFIFKLPKMGTVTVRKDRKLFGELKTATITRKNGKYYISIVTEQERAENIKVNENQVGIDMGISFFASLSNGTQIENPRILLGHQKRLRIENRALARKKIRSNSWYKQKDIVAKLHEKIAACRIDHHHKLSTNIVKQYGFIAVEDLKIANMIRFGYLSKHISDASWGSFRNMLEYKSEWYGANFLKVNPKFTSQTCNDCGETNKMSRVSQSKFVCKECGVESNADINAAKNILSKGIALYRKRESLDCALVEEPHCLQA